MKTHSKRRLSVAKIAEFVALALLILTSGYFRLRQFTAPSATPPLRVTFLDVAKGDAAVVETPSGKVMVVDTGGTFRDGGDQGERVVAPFLRSRGIRRIDVLLLTHPHGDHIGGAVSLLEQFPVGLLLDNGEKQEWPMVDRYRAVAKSRGVCCRVVRRGYEIDLGAGIVARVLAPPEGAAPGRTNNTSLVLRLPYGRTGFLLTGDAEGDEEAEMLRAGQPLACDVLKVGHRGSRVSTTPEFLAAAHPKIAVISVDTNNYNGYPHREVLDRLRECGARVYRTDRNGAITCISDGDKVRIETQKR